MATEMTELKHDQWVLLRNDVTIIRIENTSDALREVLYEHAMMSGMEGEIIIDLWSFRDDDDRCEWLGIEGEAEKVIQAALETGADWLYTYP